MSEPAPAGAPSPTGRRWADVRLRVRSALILIAITFVALMLGGIWFALLVGGAFGGVYREWEMMLTGRQPTGWGAVLLGMLGIVALAYPTGGTIASLTVLAVALLVAAIFGGPHRLWRAGGVFFLGMVITAMMNVRGETDAGILAALFLAFAVWGTDSAAFFTGRQVGGMKLSPDISPSKTWSGAFGGLAIGTLAALAVWIFATHSSWWIGLLFGALLSIVGQLGDLAESAVKRHFHLKDSSDLIPGHGGLMDRLDSLTFAILLLFVIGSLHIAGAPAAGFLYW